MVDQSKTDYLSRFVLPCLFFLQHSGQHYEGAELGATFLLSYWSEKGQQQIPVLLQGPGSPSLCAPGGTGRGQRWRRRRRGLWGDMCVKKSSYVMWPPFFPLYSHHHHFLGTGCIFLREQRLAWRFSCGAFNFPAELLGCNWGDLTDSSSILDAREARGKGDINLCIFTHDTPPLGWVGRIARNKYNRNMRTHFPRCKNMDIPKWSGFAWCIRRRRRCLVSHSPWRTLLHRWTSRYTVSYCSITAAHRHKHTSGILFGAKLQE